MCEDMPSFRSFVAPNPTLRGFGSGGGPQIGLDIGFLILCPVFGCVSATWEMASSFFAQRLAARAPPGRYAQCLAEGSCQQWD